MQHSMMLFTFFVFDRKYSFWANLGQKFKIFSLRWNLILRLIRICRTQWWCSLFYFRPEIPFWANLVQKIKIVSLRWNLIARLIRMIKLILIRLILMPVFTFFIFGQKCPFWAKLVQNVKIVSLRLNLAASLIRTCGIQWCCSLFSFSIRNGLFGQI